MDSVAIRIFVLIDLLCLFTYSCTYVLYMIDWACKMKTVSISEFRSNLLKYLKKVQHGERINVTSKGLPLATLTPPISQHSAAKAKLKKLAKTAAINDVVTPTGESWDALK